MFTALITGSREDAAIDEAAVRRELELLRDEHGRDLFIKVGDCKTGVDRITREWCKARNVPFTVFKADWNKHGNPAGPIRNREMVQSGADLCLALNAGKRPIKRTGTGDCSCQAIDAHIRTLTVYVGKESLRGGEERR